MSELTLEEITVTRGGRPSAACTSTSCRSDSPRSW
jgi:hypothetical protein